MTLAHSPLAEPSAPVPTSLFVRITGLAEAVRSNPNATAAVDELRSLQTLCVRAIRGLPGHQKTGPEVEAACGIVEFFVREGFVDSPVGGDPLNDAEKACKAGWTGLLSALLVAPAWQLKSAPRIEDTPMWLWPVYTECLLRLPPLLAEAGQADGLAEHYARRLREIARLVDTNLGSSAVRGLVDKFLLAGDCTLLCNSTGSLREILALRARILSLVNGVTKEAADVIVLPREGRRLKVGFVIESLENQSWVRAALPWFEHLDDRRYESILFSVTPSSSALAGHVATRVGELRVLGDAGREAVDVLRGGLFDVLVFFTRVTRGGDPVTALALHRVAPVQVVLDETRMTSGIPNADLTIIDACESPARESVHFTERLAVMPEAGVSFVSNSSRTPSTAEWTREGLGIPVEAVVYATVAPFRNLTPEWLACVARILASVPDSRLLVYSYHPDDGSEAELGRLCGLVGSVMSAHGVDESRLILSNEALPSESEVLVLLKVADLYLDTWPVSQGEGSLLALEAGLPVLAGRAALGHPAAAASAMSRLGFGRYVAEGAEDFATIAVRLGRGAEERAKLRSELKVSIGNAESCGDPVAYADAVGALLEKAFDEAAANGRPGIPEGGAPITILLGTNLDELRVSVEEQLRCGFAPEAAASLAPAVAACPTDPVIRGLHRRVLMAEYRFDRAADSLLSTVERQSANADLWYQLGLALRGAGKRQDALQALEVALRLNHSNLEGWLTLGEMAREAGHAEMIREIATVAVQLAPDDPRVKELAAVAGAQGA